MDVDAGRVVKGTRFIDIRDAGDPVELAAHYDATGADEVVFLDITATSDKRATVVELARRAADEVFVPFTIGGAGEILLTSMDRDGTKDGYDLELVRAVAEAVDVPVIASGGVGGPEHMVAGFAAGADAALAASIFHYGEYSVSAVKAHLAEAGGRGRRGCAPVPK